jgi:hypothetical protein
MRPLGHPDFQYTPWTPERRAAASKAARERAKAAGAKSVAKTQRKKAAPWSAKGTVNDTKRHGAIEALVRPVLSAVMFHSYSNSESKDSSMNWGSSRSWFRAWYKGSTWTDRYG